MKKKGQKSLEDYHFCKSKNKTNDLSSNNNVINCEKSSTSNVVNKSVQLQMIRQIGWKAKNDDIMFSNVDQKHYIAGQCAFDIVLHRLTKTKK